ncbi:MAG: TIGR04283 family arsenosugar biosynthesis glycosyltransferase [Halofilum sp. (in: g-proteobacteria)]|nr:TIGR04283 family arsenosugar biosynthesis glycosyltransferase [Halofilum sp. (in: g-proteobacteria)]
MIVPALDEAAGIVATLHSLQPARRAGGELVLVDGGSRDDTVERARPWVDRVLSGPAGRARQMNAGAAVAAGEWLWFVHADTRVDPEAIDDLQAVMAAGRPEWGRFGLRLSTPRPLFRLIATLVNLRSRLTGIATGDQGLFVQREAFTAVGGFPEIELMEDIALSRRLRRRGRPLCLPVRLTTSSRRWEQGGPWRTIVLMWRLRWAYWRGADPAELARRYRG